ncbi:MAG: hypothetical protein K9N62_00940 [Verrucomicrobia bacterium]|nr:hypothetical protein [Verrucomicrobiota bacterium]
MMMIREAVPQPYSIRRLTALPESEAVRFLWNGREFVVRTSLQALEIKNNRLFITGASMLLQLVLVERNQNSKALESVLDNLQQAAILMEFPFRRGMGFRLLSQIKSTLKNLCGKKIRGL